MSKVNDVDPLDRKFTADSFTTKGVRGKYFAAASKGSNVVKIDPEIARMFPSEAAVNLALASVIAMGKLTNNGSNASPTTKRTTKKSSSTA
jgi:hypothetical protein